MGAPATRESRADRARELLFCHNNTTTAKLQKFFFFLPSRSFSSCSEDLGPDPRSRIHRVATELLCPPAARLLPTRVLLEFSLPLECSLQGSAVRQGFQSLRHGVFLHGVMPFILYLNSLLSVGFQFQFSPILVDSCLKCKM